MKEALSKQLQDKTCVDYDRLADDMDATRRYLWKDLQGMLPRVEADLVVLDIGCGNGRLIQALPIKVAKYLGLDLSPALIKKAKERFGAKHPEARFEVGDADELSLSDESVDVVLMIAVLHQIPGDMARRRVLAEAFRVLKPGGEILLSVWNLWRPKYLGYLLQFTLGKLFFQHQMDWGDVLIPWKSKNVERYYHVFTFWGLKRLIQSTGFIILVNKIGHNIVIRAKKSE